MRRAYGCRYSKIPKFTILGGYLNGKEISPRDG